MARKATKRKIPVVAIIVPKCKIDHTKKGSLPKILCRNCNPQLNQKLVVVEQIDKNDLMADRLINPPTAEAIKEEKAKPTKKKDKVKTKRISIRDRFLAKSHDIIAQIEEIVD